MKINDLANLSEQARSLISEHLEKHEKTVNALSIEAGVHPTQLWLFLRGERGLTDTSLQKIGAAIIKAGKPRKGKKG